MSAATTTAGSDRAALGCRASTWRAYAGWAVAGALAALLAVAGCGAGSTDRAGTPPAAGSASAPSAAAEPSSACGPRYQHYDDTGVTDLGRPYIAALRKECVPLTMPELASAGVAACMSLHNDSGSLTMARGAVLRSYPQLEEGQAAAVVGAAQAVICADTR